MKTALSVVFALGAAALFGVSSVLQQATARREEGLPLLGLRVLQRLARRPRWLWAVSLSAVSFGVQALALAFGPLALVQPVAATDLLFALPFLARRQRQRLLPRDWLAAAMVAGGIAAFLAISPPASGSTTPSAARWTWVLVGTGGIAFVLAQVALRARGALRTGLLAGAGAVVFALVDALTKATVGLVGDLGGATLVRWEPYVLLVAGVTGIALGQGAYRSGSLLTSLPIIDSVEPVGAVLIGATAFGEQLGGSPAVLSLQLLAATVAVAGIVLLDRSPLVASTVGGAEPGRR